jgi:N-acetylneuraminate synthase
MKIANREIGKDNPVFIIAEAGVNHNGKIALARHLIAEAKKIGADAVKFQTWKTEELIIKGAKTASYQKSNTGESDQYKMIKKLELSYSDFRELKKYAEKLGIMFLSTPDEETSLNFLADELDVSAIKIGSSELTNYLYLRKIAAKRKPMILSTGMGTLAEVERAVDIIREINPEPDLAILHCTTNYPCPPNEVNLNVLRTYRKHFPSHVIGYSDHTAGIEVPLLAVALGAKIIEKHFTLDNQMDGPDHKASLNPKDFQQMVVGIRRVERILGSFIKKPTESEKKIKPVIQKVIVAKRDLPAGKIITEDALVAKRTAQKGLAPDKYKDLIGKRLKLGVGKDQTITISHVK